MARHDLIVIGAGPGGYVAAIRAAQLGLDVACVDKEERLGGTCLRIGCIPSKALLESSLLYAEARHALGAHGIRAQGVELDLAAMMKRKERIVRGLTKGVAFLFEKNHVRTYHGHARLAGAGTVTIEDRAGSRRELSADHVIIATGSRPTGIPGVSPDGTRITTSTEALGYDAVPEHLVVIGAGYIGLEMASVWSRLGARVTVLEYLDRILPGMDDDLARDARKLLAKQGIEFQLSSRVTGAHVEGETCVVEREGAESVRGDRVLVATGRAPNTDGLGLEDAGVETDDRGRIRVDQRYGTSADGVFAIGDVIPGPMLAHKASQEGVACVEWLVRGYGRVDYDAIPSVAYTDPEVASVGHTEAELAASEIEYRKGVFPFRPNGRARALGHTDGWIKVLADKGTDRVLGVQILGARAGDLIAEAVMAIEFGASSEDIARVCHAHPTLPEALREAALDVTGQAIHR